MTFQDVNMVVEQSLTLKHCFGCSIPQENIIRESLNNKGVQETNKEK